MRGTPKVDSTMSLALSSTMLPLQHMLKLSPWLGSFPGYPPVSRRFGTIVQCSSQTRVEEYSHIKHLKNLRKVRSILTQINDPMESLMKIDSLQRMGIDYHFTEEIEVILDSIYRNLEALTGDGTGQLFEVALCFRLLRQARYHVSHDIFNRFMDMEGRFKLSLTKDIRGLLSLYEASQLNEGEDVLYNAGEFSTKHLISSMGYLGPDSQIFIKSTLEHPYHKSLPRYKARKYLSHYRTPRGLNGFLHEVAMSDFNIVQSLHQRELKEVICWWKNLGLAQELSFIRDQPMKWYLWTMAILPDPLLSKIRMELVKVVAFIYIIDDIFDVYGSLDELCHFTEAINKWELSALDRLPNYMRICYKILYDITNGFAEVVLKYNGWNPINSLKKMWATLCEAFLMESKWFASKHTPTTDEYLKNGVISSGLQVVLVHLYFLLDNGITKESVELIESNPTLISCPAKILRLWDDLGSAKDENQEGIDGSYLECYIKEHPGCSTQNAREHVMNLIFSTWEQLNKECFSPSHFSTNFVKVSLNTARMVNVMYSYEDNHLPILEEYVKLLLLESL